MELKQPVIAYTAATNMEAHFIVEMLLSNGIQAHVVEDQSGVGLWGGGTASQLHKPNVWVNRSDLNEAAEWIRQFEERQQERRNPQSSPPPGTREIFVVCEECGRTTGFPGTLDGTTQECSHCGAYVDVGDLPWEEDFGVPEE